MPYIRLVSAVLGCVLGIASGAPAQVSPVGAGRAITAAGVNALSDAGNFTMPDSGAPQHASTPVGAILDSASHQISRQFASWAEQDRGRTERKDTLWNGTRNGAIIGAVAQVVLAEVVGGSIARNEGTYTVQNAARAYAINGAIGAGIGVLVDWGR